MTESESVTLRDLLRCQGFVLLDGGLATTLEAGGADLNDPLWSARVLLEEPERVAAVHRAFVDAGADVIATATYQATFEGLAARGLNDSEACRLMQTAVDLARQAALSGSRAGAGRALVAASIGPYGAYLADGSEYRGDYGLDESQLRDFHEKRFRLLAGSGADLLAFETVPDAREASALLELLENTPGVEAWLSFTLRDAAHLSDGEPVTEVVARLAARYPRGWERLVAVGANCVSPSRLEDALPVFAKASDKPIVAYPNSGERYAAGEDGEGRGWSGGACEWVARGPLWRQRGAYLIGGCCRTSPDDIARLRQLLSAGG